MRRYKNILIATLAFHSAFLGASFGDDYLLKAQNNDAEAQFILSCRYSAGFNAGSEKLARDEKKSMFWLEQSALNGFQNAQLLMALRYAKGDFVQKNELVALAWCMTATSDWEALEFAQALKSKMSDHELELAREYSKRFQEKIEKNKKLDGKSPMIKGVSDMDMPSAKDSPQEAPVDFNWFMTHVILGDINFDKYKGRLFKYSRYPHMFDTEARLLKNSPVDLEDAKVQRVESGSAIVVRTYDFMGAVLCAVVDSGLGRGGYFFLNSKRKYQTYDFVQNGVFKLSEYTLPIDEVREAYIFVEE